MTTERSTAMRAALEAHVAKRLQESLERILGSDSAAKNKNANSSADDVLKSILEKGSKTATRIQMATHIAKATHSALEVKIVSNLRIALQNLPKLPVVGSHALGENYFVDATGDGAINKSAFEAYLLLSASYEGKPFLEHLKAGCSDAIAALHDDPATASKLADALCQIDGERCSKPASHNLLKQVYWPVKANAHADNSYHLLSLLYPASLTHRMYQNIQKDLYGKTAKTAREARKNDQYSPTPIHDYPQAAIQKIGGTKPLNISQLNSEKVGKNRLLCSLPPEWINQPVQPLYGVNSFFKRWGKRRSVWETSEAMLKFLASKPPQNDSTHKKRDTFLQTLLDDLTQYTCALRGLPIGWSQHSACTLPKHQAQWLDPQEYEKDATMPKEVVRAVANDFAHWLNAQLRQRLPVSAPEHRYWSKMAYAELRWLESDAPVDVAAGYAKEITHA